MWIVWQEHRPELHLVLYMYTLDTQVSFCTYSNTISTAAVVTAVYLPDSHIARAFRYIWRHNADPAVDQLCQYIQETWIASVSEQWPPSAWSVFRSTIRTNNDVEGWHRALNNRACRGQLQLYVLLLQREASLLPLQAKLVREKKLQRRVCVQFSSLSYQ